MLSICCEFAVDCNIVFNNKKTVCINIGDKVSTYEHAIWIIH